MNYANIDYDPIHYRIDGQSIFSVDVDNLQLAIGGPLGHVQEPERGRLPRPVGTDQRDHRPSGDSQVNVPNCLDVAVV